MFTQREYNPIFKNLIEEMIRLYDHNLTPSKTIGLKTPLANIVEENESFQIEMAIPGFKKEEIEIQLKEDTLTIKSNIPENRNNNPEKQKTEELVRTPFSRSFHIPHNMNKDQIEARHADGILYIKIPKTKETTAKTKEIPIA